ncbi:MAG: hypothetical protein C5B50_13740 [Verrucomicrobia bacterium]|nr:MAG: hypothetical protein C5B50_13740 [Verrucomicrobiota bacterium]
MNEPGRFPEGVKQDYEICLKEGRAYILVAEKNGQIIASGGVFYTIRTNIAGMCFGLVHPDYQGKGIGTSLLLSRLALLNPAEDPQHVVICAVEKSIEFYCRFGFIPGAPWKDKHGQQHPSGHLVITGEEIKKCRNLLASHHVSFPVVEDQIPFRERSSEVG